MKEKKSKASIFIIIGCIFIVLYIIFAVRPLGKEYEFNPEWKISVSNPTVSPNWAEDSTYFKLGKSMGYYTDDGKVVRFETFTSKAAISEYYYCSYDSNAKNIDFYNNNGQLQGTIEPEGFPMFHKDRIYVFLPGGSSFSRCDASGKTAWDIESIMPITAFSSNEKYTSVGYANGLIKIIDNKTGATDLSYSPGGSDYPIIFGLDTSSDGNYIASVSGRNKQRFTLAKKEDKQPKIIYHTFLNNELDDRTLVKFTEDGKRVFYNIENGIGIFNLEKNRNTFIKADKQIIDMVESDNLVFLLGKNKTEYTVYIVQKTDVLEGSFSFSANSAFIKTKNNNLYLGKDSTISKISLVRD